MMAPLTSASGKQSLQSRLGRFFYAEEVPYGLALARIFLPLVALGAMLPRWFHARELYSTDGAATPLWNAYGWPDMLPEPSGMVAVGLATLLILALITACIGWCTRASLLFAFVSYTYLTLLDATGTMTKYSVVVSHVLLLLSLSQCGAVWSVDSWLRKRRMTPSERSAAREAPKSVVWPRRLIQILIGAVYFGSAMTKLHTPAYFSSDQLVTWMQTNVNFHNPIGETLSLFPALLVIFAYVAIVWEILFLFLCWGGKGRTFMIALGLLFHVMTTVMLGLYIFPLVFIAIYFSFMSEDDVRNFAWQFRRLKQRFGWHRRRRPSFVAAKPRSRLLETISLPSPVLFCGIAVIVAALGIETEYRMDPYGKRRPQGPYALKELDAKYVEQTLLRRAGPIRPEDMIADFQAGTTLISGILAFSKSEFQQGQLAIVQATLSPPHEDMFLECALHDADDHVVDIVRRQARREMFRCNFYYTLSYALEPGEYSFVLKRRGRELLRRRIRILPGKNSPDAN